MYLIVNHGRKHHPSIDAVEELESVLLQSSNISHLNGRRPLPLIFGRVIWFLYKRGFWKGHLPISLTRTNHNIEYFAVLRGQHFRNLLPYFAIPSQKYVYLFDAWPHIYREILDFVSCFQVRRLFVSSKESATRLAAEMSSTTVHWIPEGVNPTLYRTKPPEDRKIDVLQIGRKWDAYHQRIQPSLKSEGYVYLFEKIAGHLVFPSRNDFLEGLSNSKISICFPSSVTHPDRAGDVTTLTNRYLQSMVSRCLVVGVAPPELIELFGYDPVIGADLQNPTEQLKRILSQFSQYQNLIELNYNTVCENHTWANRWDEIRKRIGR